MNLEVELNEKTSHSLSRDLLKRVARETIFLSECGFLGPKKVSISIASVSSDDIRKINKQYRKKNKDTDILSFSNYESSDLMAGDDSESVFLGELIVSCEFIEKSAKINNVPFEREMVFIISHGVLHLLGYVHGERMFNIQDEVVKLLTD